MALRSPAVILSPRMYEVLRRRALGQTTAQIAEDLGISEHTVNQHSIQIFVRLNAHCLADALRAVGWLKVPE